ncbi:MAG TPA: CBS domain-containing protein [Candidatus Methylomirabilis sp.]|nr:CBS domain-containing protein [Candidatus Methylomirabilis sp.]
MLTDQKVRDLMTPQPQTVGPDTPLRAAISLMKERRIRHLPVLEEGGRLVGILTDRDLRHAAFVPALSEYLNWDAQRLKSPRVRDVMTWSVVTTQPDATVIQAALTLFQRRIGCLPVVENGCLVGILTDHDVIGALSAHGTEAKPEELGR